MAFASAKLKWFANLGAEEPLNGKDPKAPKNRRINLVIKTSSDVETLRNSPAPFVVAK